jgi:hypothetical protein
MWLNTPAKAQEERGREGQENEAREIQKAQRELQNAQRELQRTREGEGGFAPGPMVLFRGEGMRPNPWVGEFGEPGVFLGVGVSESSPVLSHQLKLQPGVGLVVDVVQPNSPAAQAGVQQYDLLEKMDDQLLVNLPQLMTLVRMHKAGDSVKLSLIREGNRQQVTVQLAERPRPALGGMKRPINENKEGSPNKGEGEKGQVKPNPRRTNPDEDNEK